MESGVMLMPNILVNLPYPLLSALDALAASRAEPGMKANRNEAMRYLVCEWMDTHRPEPAATTPKTRTAKER